MNLNCDLYDVCDGHENKYLNCDLFDVCDGHEIVIYISVNHDIHKNHIHYSSRLFSNL